MKIYLAGKMDELGNWRDGLLEPKPYPPRPLWHTTGSEDALYNGDDADVINWPTGPNRLVLGVHEYTGPYRSTIPHAPMKWLGILHGNDGNGQHGMMDSGGEKDLSRLCLSRIEQSDLVFGYLNSFDSFGALVEIGYAAARGKFIVVVENAEASGDESLWFAQSLAHVRQYYSPVRWTEEGEHRLGCEHERASLRAALLEGISRYAAWREAHVRRPDVRATASQSFQQIIQWTSDPRVRSEARRMVRLLEGAA